LELKHRWVDISERPLGHLLIVPDWN